MISLKNKRQNSHDNDYNPFDGTQKTLDETLNTNSNHKSLSVSQKGLNISNLTESE